LKELKHPKPTLATVLQMLAEVNLETHDVITYGEFVIMWKNRPAGSGGWGGNGYLALAKAMGLVADPAVVHALLAVMAAVACAAEGKADARAARRAASRAAAAAPASAAVAPPAGPPEPRGRPGPPGTAPLAVAAAALPWEGEPPGVAALHGRGLLRELGGPYDPRLPLIGCLAYHAPRLTSAGELREQKAAAAVAKAAAKAAAKAKAAAFEGKEDDVEVRAEDKFEGHAVSLQAASDALASAKAASAGGCWQQLLPRSLRGDDGWRNSCLSFDPHTRVLSCRAAPYGVDRAASAQGLALAQASLKATAASRRAAAAERAGGASSSRRPATGGGDTGGAAGPVAPLVPPGAAGPDRPPLLWARTVGEEEPAEVLDDPVSAIHGYFYVVFSKASEAENAATGDEATGAAATAAGILVAAPSEAVRRLWVDTINGQVEVPVGGLFAPPGPPDELRDPSGSLPPVAEESGEYEDSGSPRGEPSGGLGGAPVRGEGLEDVSLASVVASVQGEGDEADDESEADAFGAFDAVEGGHGAGPLSAADAALYREADAAEAVRDKASRARASRRASLRACVERIRKHEYSR